MSKSERQTVAIIDDDNGLRASLVDSLASAGIPAVPFECVGEYLLWEPSGAPACVLVSLTMPGLNGIHLLEAFVRRKYAPAVIMVSASADVESSVCAMKAGAADFLTKPIDRTRLMSAVQKALEFDRRRRIARLETRGMRDRYATLTDIERTIFHGIVSGRLNKQLAVDIAICERTIKTHRARVMSKLQVASIVDLTRAAMTLGVLGKYRSRINETS